MAFPDSVGPDSTRPPSWRGEEGSGWAPHPAYEALVPAKPGRASDSKPERRDRKPVATTRRRKRRNRCPRRNGETSGLSFFACSPIHDSVKTAFHQLVRTLITMGLALIAGAAVSAVEDAPASEHFPAPPGLEPEIQFWTRIYTEVDGRQGLLHDTRDLGVVYEQVEVPRSASPKTRERLIEGHKEKYRGILRKLGRGQRSKLSSDEARVLALFPTGVQNETLRSASRRIRFQLGQADRFRAGLIRSGAYEDHIQSTLAEMGLPAEIAALPHVESSYTPQAYSRIGAAGLWQFTRSTGRRFMRVDHVVDERLDPYLATVAAARLLEQNHRVTGSWPLAITAYNHGASGMRRAVRKLGTRDIERIVREYRGRTFGFASRNFYVEFIAASRIASSPEQHFGTFVRDSPIDYEEGEMPFYGTPSSIAQALNIPLDTLRAANPALRPSVWRGDKRIPRGFNLKVPRAELNRPIQKGLQAVPSESRHARQTRDAHHVIQRGKPYPASHAPTGFAPVTCRF